MHVAGLMEEEKLQSRLEQQSNLICMLKQRNDKTLKEVSKLELVLVWCHP